MFAGLGGFGIHAATSSMSGSDTSGPFLDRTSRNFMEVFEVELRKGNVGSRRLAECHAAIATASSPPTASSTLPASGFSGKVSTMSSLVGGCES